MTKKSQKIEEQIESGIQDFKRLSLGMKLITSFALSYYFFLFVMILLALIFNRYLFDSKYYNLATSESMGLDIFHLVLILGITTFCIVSLILIFLKKKWGKWLFAAATVLLIVYQLTTTGFDSVIRYFIEIFILIAVVGIRFFVKPLKTLKAKKLENEAESETIEKMEDTL